MWAGAVDRMNSHENDQIGVDEGDSSTEPSREKLSLRLFVLSVRRDIAGLIDAMIEVDIGVQLLTRAFVEQVQRCDEETRVVFESTTFDSAKVRDAALALRLLEAGLTDDLGHSQLSRVRAAQRWIEDPRTRPLCDRREDPALAFSSAHREPGERSVLAGLQRESRRHLEFIANRLGVPTGRASGGPVNGERRMSRHELERRIAGVLGNLGMLRILVATLPEDARRLLRALVLGELSAAQRAELSVAARREKRLELSVAPGPAQLLSECGLVFAGRGELWIPDDLQESVQRAVLLGEPKPRFLV